MKQVVEFKNKHLGETCFIVGNGPSLNKTDLSLLTGYTVFALNRGYLKGDLPFTYLVSVNANVEKQWGQEIINAGAKAVFSHSLVGDNVVRLRFTPDVPKFTENIADQIWQGHTVTFVAMQIAYYMGFKNVGLVGIDHNFPYMDKELKGGDINHFDPNYFPEGSKWDLPNLRMSEVAYKLAKEYYEKNNRVIYNCTPNSKLTIFRKLSLNRFIQRY